MAKAFSITGLTIERAMAAPRFVPPSFEAPDAWPRAWRWRAAARRNALELFPRRCFTELFVEHRIFGQRIVMLSDPASIADVTGSGGRNFRLTNMHLRMLAPALGRGVIVAEGEAWRRQRRASVQIAASARPRLSEDSACAATSSDRIAALVDRWADAPGAVSIQPALALLSVDLMACTLFAYSAPVGDQRVLAAIDGHRATVEQVDWLDIVGAPVWLSTTRLRRARSIAGSFDAEINAAIAATETLMAAEDMGPETMRDLVVNLLAGFESVATTATWLLGLIGSHPPLYDWLTDTVVDDVQRAARLTATIRETMRLFPPLPMVYRQALRDHVTPVGLIRKGSLVCMASYVVHRHERLWRDPDTFDPARFLPDERNPAYIPFGMGARQCVGQYVGPVLIARIVSAINARLRPRLAGPLPVARAGLSLRPATSLSLTFDHV